jgi:predicted Na+-dependent transporter
MGKRGRVRGLKGKILNAFGYVSPLVACSFLRACRRRRKISRPMKTLDRTSSLFWLLVSILVFAESLRIGIGTVQNPGMGFMTFGASGILGILSLVLFLQASLRKEDTRGKPLFAGAHWQRVLFVLLALVAYAVLMPTLGYLVSTFLLMSLLFWVLERGRLGFVLLWALLATISTHLVFSKWLNCQFPHGWFGF